MSLSSRFLVELQSANTTRVNASKMGLSYSWLLYTGLKILRQWIVPTRAHHQLLVHAVEHEFVTLDNRMQVPGS